MNKSIMLKLIFILFFGFSVSAQDNWQILFNGEDLKNFEQLNGNAPYEIKNQELIGTSKMGTPNSFMATKKKFSDFILEFDVFVENGLNSGVQFRSLSTPEYNDGRVHGYQCEIETSSRKWAGGVYDEARNGWLYPLSRNPKGQHAFVPGQWNHYRIEAIGNEIRTWVNDVQCANLIDDTTAEGFIAFQVHGIGKNKDLEGKKVKWKNIKIKTTDLENSRKEVDPDVPEISYLTNTLSETEKRKGWRFLWDGKTTNGWRGAKLDKFPDKGWEMKDGILTVLSSGGAESRNGGDIVTEVSYNDFELSVDFKISKGANSGIKYFVDSELNKGEGSAIGLEFQVLDDKVHPDAKMGKNGNRTVGSLYDLIRAENTDSSRGKNFKGVGNWNNARIVVKGGHVEHWLNQIKVVEFDRFSQPFKALVEKSKYEKWENFGRIPEGLILLQDHGDEVSFKNIKYESFKSKNQLKMDKARRNFIKKTTLASSGIILGANSMSAKSYTKIIGANDRVRVGIAGFSNRFKGALLPAFNSLSKAQNFELVGVSDIWNRRREEGMAKVKEVTGSKITSWRNNEEMYDKNDIDAVIISTADFQHALHTVQAATAKKDVYCEKPFAETMDDARVGLKAVKDSGIVFQIGSQRRSGANYHAANNYVKSGKFGDIVMVEMTWNVNQPGRWRLPKLTSEIKESDTDWKRYQMNRPLAEWDPRKYLEYRLFWPYSSGIPGQWMSHQIDTVHWFSGLNHPRSVAANGGIYLWKDGRKNFDTMSAVFDYGPSDDMSSGFQVTYSSRFTNSAGGTKEIYYSNAGELNLDTNKVSDNGGLVARHANAMDMQPNKLEGFSLTEEAPKVVTSANTGADNMTTLHMLNWMECVRSRETTNGPVEAGYNHSIANIMTTAALRTGLKATFDEATQDVLAGGKVFQY